MVYLSFIIKLINSQLCSEQTESEKVQLLTEHLRLSQNEKKDLEDEVNQLKKDMEEAKESFQHEILRLHEAHQSEIMTISNKSHYFQLS